MTEIKKPIKISLTDQVCASLREKIENGDFPVGSRLPSETELAEIFGVSRITVRMALQKLNAQGLIYTKQGDGTFVKEFDLAEYIDGISELTLKPEVLDSVLEFRQYIEAATINLTIARASDEDFQQLNKLQEQMQLFYYDRRESREVWEKKLDEFLELDFQFHLTICSLSRNFLFHLAYLAAKAPIIAYMRQVIQSRFEVFQREHPHQERFYIELLADSCSHEQIFRHLKDRDQKAALESLLEPIDYKKPTPL